MQGPEQGQGPGQHGKDSKFADLGAHKIKLASVLDQADDSEVKPLDVHEQRNLLDVWKRTRNDGEEPAEEEEATGDQISALSFRLKSGSTPYVDFGVWRPHGADLGRTLKFAAYFINPAGDFTRKEVVGPTSFHEWQKSWRVFAFAMELLGAASRTRMARYHSLIQGLDNDYPSMWWLIALADQKMRRTHFERIRRRLANEHAEITGVGLKSDFDPLQPWDLVFREAARDRDFWYLEVEKKVVQYVTAQRSRPQLADPEFGQLRFAGALGKRSGGDFRDEEEEPPKKRQQKKSKREKREDTQKKRDDGGQNFGGGGKGKGKGPKNPDKKDAQGKYIYDEDGNQLCWGWNKSKDGCSSICPNRRTHKCEICRGNHRTCEHRD